MAELDGYRLPDLGPPLTIAERMDKMVAAVTRADREGVLSPLPEAREDSRKEDLHGSRLVTIRTRLHLLGYLRTDSGKARVDRQLQRAIGRFQEDADLKVDRWVGAETWSALQQLVDFESPLDLDRWSRPEAGKGVWRAARLRLHTLGLLTSRTVRSQAKVERALERLSAVAWMLRLTPTRLPATLQRDTLEVLFNQDRLAAALAAENGLASSRPEAISASRVERFMVSVAAVELWLLGYDVPLDGRGTYRRPPGILYLPGAYPLFYALEQFWRARGKGKAQARERAGVLGPTFFRQLGAVEREAQSGAPVLDGERVYREIKKLGKRSQRDVWGHVKRIGSRLWDGVKRVWRWITAIIGRVRRVFHRVVEWTKNLARLAYRYALRGFAAVKRAVGRVAGAIEYLSHEVAPDSDPEHVVIRRDRDLDYTVCLSPGRDAGRVRAITSNLVLQARFFAAGVRVLGRLVALTIDTLRTVSWAVGWFGLILALVRLFRDLRRFARAGDDDLELLTAPAQ